MQKNNEIIGFLCFAMNENDSSNFRSASISYGAVKETFRRQGIMRGMIDFICDKNNSVVLSCSIENVNIFKKIGFSPSSPSGAQVGMHRGKEKKCQYIIVDTDDFNPMLQKKAISIKGKAKFETFLRRYSSAYQKECNRVKGFFRINKFHSFTGSN